MKFKYLLPLLSPVALFSISDYSFVHEPTCNWHIEASSHFIGNADFKHRPSHVRYADAALSLYYYQYLNEHNILSWQVGYSYFNLDWDKNPRFSQQNFPLGIASVAWIFTGCERWRFLVNVGGTVSTKTWNLNHTGVGFGLITGRYAFRPHVGIHIGYVGYGGMHQFYSLPIAGIDWTMSERWKLTAIYPLDGSLEYKLGERWSLAAVYTSLGGPYRYPTRAQGGHGKFHDPIFEVYSTGAELDLNYTEGNLFWASIGAGFDFGGWILVKDHRGRHNKYYKFGSAPYAQANLGYSF